MRSDEKYLLSYTKDMQQRVVLLVLDGWGIGGYDYTNPLFVAKPKHIEAIKARYLSGALQSSGIAVGLPWDEDGNSEVGHLTIGAGKVLYQHYPRITLAIRDNSFFKNGALISACEHAKQSKGSLHLAGLLTEGNVHASLEHIKALLRLAKENGITNLRLHLFADGKDSAPQSLRKLLGQIRGFIKEIGIGTIESLSGRFYALDRDEHWVYIEKTYRAMTGGGPILNDPETHIQETYAKNLGDEFIEPFSVGPEPHLVQDGDALIFFDFREDSIQELASAFILKTFDKFRVEPFSNLAVVTMTNYSSKFEVPVAFPPERIDEPLGKVLADHGALQLRVAETERYAHVTFFFNGYREKPFSNEYRVLIPSRNVASHDLSPEMMVHEVAARVIEGVEEGGFNFILTNFANADIIAHTGNFDAALQAIAAVDAEIGRITEACLAKNTALIITSDHGHIETMIDRFTGLPRTTHNTALVPFYLIGKNFERQKNEETIAWVEKEAIGILADVAPTVLELLGFPKPLEMTGQSLLRTLR